ncbi:hypothetical protein AN217_04805 [Streptomyces qinglanensis]|uniref:Uncharacterized protein n=1 Tax=Streptomyces qinglanensis TaxID=943816 RepID=A0A1E7K056_9ACTN|nr:hypothetical protein AN217_04805 [Streptomyces qinglanensis]OEV23183.1 hypothetical protein AN220_25750 [Streptomyces nanshensis]
MELRDVHTLWTRIRAHPELLRRRPGRAGQRAPARWSTLPRRRAGYARTRARHGDGSAPGRTVRPRRGTGPGTHPARVRRSFCRVSGTGDQVEWLFSVWAAPAVRWCPTDG